MLEERIGELGKGNSELLDRVVVLEVINARLLERTLRLTPLSFLTFTKRYTKTGSMLILDWA